MIPTDRCALEELPTRPGEAPRARVLLGGAPTGVELRADHLAAQFQCGPGYLIFATKFTHEGHDLRILLLSDRGQRLDEVVVLTTGAFLGPVHPSGDAEATFELAQRWRVRVRAHPTRLPVNALLSLLLAVARDLPASAPRWLELRRGPRTAGAQRR